MSQPEGESFWVHIHDTREGKHFYKFLVDGLWSVEDTEVKVEREDKQWNMMEVKRSDFEVFDALACDSFSLKNSEKNKSEKNFKSDSWCQVKKCHKMNSLKSCLKVTVKTFNGFKKLK